MLEPLDAVAGVTWSAAVLVDGTVAAVSGADVVVPTASVGKVFLLLTVAEQIVDGSLDPTELLTPSADDIVADSGLLQHLHRQRQRIDDLAAMVGAVSDNLATNVLLRRVGIDAVGELTARLGLVRSGLHDFVRDRRDPALHPSALSSGCAIELVDVMDRVATGGAISEAVSAAVTRWIALNTDLSMVAAAFTLDPLAHVDPDVGVRLVNKTGTTTGTRVEIATVSARERRVSYAVAARWTSAADEFEQRTAVLSAMREVGHNVRNVLLA